MTSITEGYISRRTCGSNHQGKHGKKIYRDWFFVKYNPLGNAGGLHLGTLWLPKELIGKKVRFKMEIIE